MAKATLKTTESVTVSAHILDVRVARLDVNVRVSVDLSVSMKPDKPREDQEVTFTIKPSDPDITGEWSMNFGDGTSKNLGSHKGTVTAAHTYSRAGGYNATARFKPSGADEVRQTIRVTVEAASPAPSPEPQPEPEPTNRSQSRSRNRNQSPSPNRRLQAATR